MVQVHVHITFKYVKKYQKNVEFSEIFQMTIKKKWSDVTMVPYNFKTASEKNILIIKTSTYFTVLITSQFAKPVFRPFCSLVRPWMVSS